MVSWPTAVHGEWEIGLPGSKVARTRAKVPNVVTNICALGTGGGRDVKLRGIASLKRLPAHPIWKMSVESFMAARIAMFFAMLLMLPAALGAEEDLQHQLLFDSGREGYKRYRIPSLLVAPCGAVLAICEGRIDGGGLLGNIDIVVRRSVDSGKSWSPMKVVADDENNTLGNPCAVVDASTKTIWLALTRSLGSDTEEQIVAGTSRERTRVLITKSIDDGETWSPPIDISATTRQPTWTWYGTGPGTGIQLQNGRLLIPSYHAEEKTGVYRSHMIYSDDHGQTWHLGAAVGKHCGECHVVERQNGELVLNARTNQGRERRTTAVSTDGGTTWSKASFEEALFDPHCEACLIRVPAETGQKPNWLFSHPAGPGRRDLTVRLSSDEGKTWPVSRLIRRGDSQYSSLAKLQNGLLGCLYDCWVDGNYRVFFVTFVEPMPGN